MAEPQYDSYQNKILSKPNLTSSFCINIVGCVIEYHIVQFVIKLTVPATLKYFGFKELILLKSTFLWVLSVKSHKPITILRPSFALIQTQFSPGLDGNCLNIDLVYFCLCKVSPLFVRIFYWFTLGLDLVQIGFGPGLHRFSLIQFWFRPNLNVVQLIYSEPEL